MLSNNPPAQPENNLSASLPARPLTDQRLTLLSDPVVSTQELPIKWRSAHNADFVGAKNYQAQAGAHLDYQKLAGLLGGDEAHLRLNVLASGLPYVTVHLADGSEIVDWSAHNNHAAMLMMAGHAEMWRGPKLDPNIMTDGGFRVEAVVNETALPPSTFCEVKKNYSTADSDVSVKAEIFSAPDRTRSVLNCLMADSASFEERACPAAILGRKGPDIIERVPATSWRLVLGSARNGECSMSVSCVHQHGASSRLPSMSDAVFFEFDSDGLLVRASGRSKAEAVHPLCGDPDFEQAILKGLDTGFDYRAGATELAVLSKALLGADFSSAPVDYNQAGRNILKQISQGGALDVRTALCP